MVGRLGIFTLSPSIADEMDIAGVIKPSAIRVAQPMSEGTIIHAGPRFFSLAYNANIPPSP